MVEQLKKPVILLVGFFLLLFLYTKLAGPIPFAVNSVSTTTPDVFQVNGEGKAVAVPDTASISFGVTKTAPTVADAQNQTNTAISDITSALKDAGIDEKDMQTTNYSVNPNYDITGRQTITGYTVTQNILLKIAPLDKANKAVDIITAKGANIVGQVSFGFSDSLKKQLEDKARKMAVDAAKEKAQSLAGASGIHLGKIINVVENPQETPIIQPFALPAAKDAASEGTPTQVTPGQNTVSLTVTLSYQTY